MNRTIIVNQFNSIVRRGWLPYFQDAGYGMPVHILLGIGSRETNLQNILGDGGHGYGIMQIDDRYFPEWCRSGKVDDVREAIRMGAFVLRSKYNQAESAGVRKDDLMHVAIAMYNAGPHALEDYLVHGSPDMRTTGHNYSEDVLARAETFRELLNESGPKA